MHYKTVFEDDQILVIDKPAGADAAQLPFYPAHRLDKDTSGLLVIAKNQPSLKGLQRQFKQRQVKKQYLALAFGDVDPKKGELVTALARDKSRRVPFKVVLLSLNYRGTPREARTRWEAIKKLTVYNQQLTLLKIRIATGRTHQIRVHLKHLGFPLAGDKIYNTKASKRFSKGLGLDRQFLHANQLALKHPKTQKIMLFESKLPLELKRIINKQS